MTSTRARPVNVPRAALAADRSLPFFSFRQHYCDNLKKADLVGTPFIDANWRPSIFLQVEFPSGVAVELGNDIKAADGADEPTISFTAEDPTTSDSTYTLVSFDPDAPSREDQSKGPWRHLVRGGFKPKSLDQISASGGSSLVERSDEELLSPWVGPSPGAGTGKHRYIFLLYKQSGPLKPLAEQPHLKSNERIDRRNFNAKGFAESNGLELVGANFFMCENP
ncbi:hypothetical protein RQP46_001031 [Phenoliferia psychrophenolica]